MSSGLATALTFAPGRSLAALDCEGDTKSSLGKRRVDKPQPPVELVRRLSTLTRASREHPTARETAPILHGALSKSRQARIEQDLKTDALLQIAEDVAPLR